jgi:sulfide:quinone oxidoreductase
MNVNPPQAPGQSCRPRVIIAGGGVAGLEAVLALRALAAERVTVTMVAPEPRFVNHSMSADQPFKPKRSRGLRLQDAAADLGTYWHRGTIDRVETWRKRAVTTDGDALYYDMLVLAPGARPERAGEQRQPRAGESADMAIEGFDASSPLERSA